VPKFKSRYQMRVNFCQISPDEGTFVFQLDRSGNFDLYKMRSDVVTLTDSPARNGANSCSPYKFFLVIQR